MTKLNNFERLSLMLQASMHQRSSVDYGINPNFISHCLSRKHEWALNWKYDWLDKEDHELDASVEEVCDIFDVYRNIQRSGDEIGLPKSKTRFPGFDANNDSHYGIATTMVEWLESYEDLEGATSNSHSRASIDRYRRQVVLYKEMMRESIERYEYRSLTAEEIEKLLG